MYNKITLVFAVSLDFRKKKKSHYFTDILCMYSDIDVIYIHT